MKTNGNALVRVGSGIVPPLTRRQLLLATAEAMAREYNEKKQLADAAIAEARAKRDAKLRKLATKHIRDAEMGVNPWARGGKLTVTFEVCVPEADVEAEQAALRACPVMRLKTAEDFYGDLRRAAADATDSRIHDLLRDAGIRAKLTEAGNSLLGKTAKTETIPV